MHRSVVTHKDGDLKTREVSTSLHLLAHLTPAGAQQYSAAKFAVAMVLRAQKSITPPLGDFGTSMTNVQRHRQANLTCPLP